MQKITIQQAIFLLSTLIEKEREFSSALNEYKVPLYVNGKDVSNPKKKEEMLEDIKELNSIQEDIITLKSILAKSNVNTIIDGKSINYYLEEVRIKRNYLNTLNNLLRSNYTKVENAVGVVQYGVLNEEKLRKEARELETKVNELSQKIDSINSSTYIEIELKAKK
ncbi:MAG: hypothetical protein Q4A58_03355 [Fusobacterium sp.]|uniref:hypothetical protein n=1 Tax=Fusobacterium sp. TaxID=68766 RepID=UPI0026DD0440|nr:hypothetical protein [Fusobacterium sp.]MDO4690314.1 hypothetical protein [Fusobacterium sp.]